jgi:thioredoxin-like negative regulator of GroEL
MKFISITPENVSEYKDLIVKQNMPSLVKMYSPTCWHCQQMQDAWNKLASENELQNMDIAIIEVRNDTLDEINHESIQNINGFPTIRVIVDGKIIKEYDGDRSLIDMTEFIKTNLNKQKHMSKQKGGRKSARKLGRKSARKPVRKYTRKSCLKSTRKSCLKSTRKSCLNSGRKSGRK